MSWQLPIGGKCEISAIVADYAPICIERAIENVCVVSDYGGLRHKSVCYLTCCNAVYRYVNLPGGNRQNQQRSKKEKQKHTHAWCIGFNSGRDIARPCM